jgi:hypothetical protein
MTVFAGFASFLAGYSGGRLRFKSGNTEPGKS